MDFVSTGSGLLLTAGLVLLIVLGLVFVYRKTRQLNK